MELSREDYKSKEVTGSSRFANNADTSGEPSYLRKQTLNGRLTTLESEISSIDNQINELRNLRSNLVQERGIVEKQLREVGHTRNGTSGAVEGKGKGRARQDGIDYTLEFDWSHELMARMKKVFGIDNFRLCQRGYFRSFDTRVFGVLTLMTLQGLQCEHGRA